MNDIPALLQVILTEGLGARTLDRLLNRLRLDGIPISEYVRFTPQSMAEIFPLSTELTQQIKANYERAQPMAEELERHQIKTVLKDSGGYPLHLKRLNENAPPVLFIKGDLQHCSAESVGFSGPRKPSAVGRAAATLMAQSLAQKRIHVVSGYADGIDLAAHRGALKAGGTTTFVLAEGILKFRIKRSIAEWLTDSNYVVISEFPPDSPWATGYALQRNRTICGLSQALAAIEPGFKGGTYSTACHALKLHCPLFVLMTDASPEHKRRIHYFTGRGATWLNPRATRTPDIAPILEVLKNPPVFEQQPLLFGEEH